MILAGVSTVKRERTKVAEHAIWYSVLGLCNLLKASAHDLFMRQECNMRNEQIRSRNAPLAQSVERFHGKEKVNGSIPLGGSLDWMARRRVPRVGWWTVST